MPKGESAAAPTAEPATPTAQPASPTAESEAPQRKGSGRALASLAIVVAIGGIGLQFYPEIRQTVETYAGPLPWLPERIGPAPVLMVTTGAGSAPAQLIMPPEFVDMRETLADLSVDFARLDAEMSAALASLKSAEDAGKQTAALQDQVRTLETSTKADGAELKTVVSSYQAQLAELKSATSDLQTQLGEIQSSVSSHQAQLGELKSVASGLQAQLGEIKSGMEKLAEAYAKLSAPDNGPLLAAKLVLLSVNGALAPEDIDPLARLVGADPALAEAAARVRTLTGEDVLTVAALQAQFEAIKNMALERARRLQLTWLESGLSTAHAVLADLGLTHPQSEEKDELVIAEATREMNNGRLGRALFELQAASPELRQQLAAWTSAAQLRINLDTSLQQLIDGLMERQAKPAGAPPAD